MTDQPQPRPPLHNEPPTDQTPVERLIDRIEYLIRTDKSLTVVETVGALHMIAARIVNVALMDDDV